MKVEVVTKPGCVLCLAAKDKLYRLGVEFSELSEDASKKLSSERGGLYPLIIIDGNVYDYPGAMKYLKEVLRK
jgi:glutaredoxin